MGVIQIDTRQKMGQKHHKIKEQSFIDMGYKVVHSKMLVGDYQIVGKGNIACDSKQSCSELYQDLIQDHARFHNECVLSQDCGIKLYIVVENKEGFKKPEDIIKWKNPQMFRYYKAKRIAQAKGIKEPKPPASNVQLLKIMHSMTRDYGVEFIFCSTAEAGRKIIELLEGENNGTEENNSR